jgi:hypothetical protein
VTNNDNACVSHGRNAGNSDGSISSKYLLLSQYIPQVIHIATQFQDVGSLHVSYNYPPSAILFLSQRHAYKSLRDNRISEGLEQSLDELFSYADQDLC